jgi:hypothetical protein
MPSRSFLGLRGGFTRNNPSSVATSPSVSVRWCGVVSAVTFARRLKKPTSAAESAVETWVMCTLAPVSAASTRAVAVAASSALAGEPGIPARAA